MQPQQRGAVAILAAAAIPRLGWLASSPGKPTSRDSVTPSGDPRDARLEALYGQDLTNQEIAVHLGVSRERVRQLLQRYEIHIRPLRERRFLAAVTGRETEIVAAFVELRSDAAVVAGIHSSVHFLC
jgi:hypothetical protein